MSFLSVYLLNKSHSQKYYVKKTEFFIFSRSKPIILKLIIGSQYFLRKSGRKVCKNLLLIRGRSFAS
jgi:hypothetical protein